MNQNSLIYLLYCIINSKFKDAIINRSPLRFRYEVNKGSLSVSVGDPDHLMEVLTRRLMERGFRYDKNMGLFQHNATQTRRSIVSISTSGNNLHIYADVYKVNALTNK